MTGVCAPPHPLTSTVELAAGCWRSGELRALQHNESMINVNDNVNLYVTEPITLTLRQACHPQASVETN